MMVVLKDQVSLSVVDAVVRGALGLNIKDRESPSDETYVYGNKADSFAITLLLAKSITGGYSCYVSMIAFTDCPELEYLLDRYLIGRIQRSFSIPKSTASYWKSPVGDLPLYASPFPELPDLHRDALLDTIEWWFADAGS